MYPWKGSIFMPFCPQCGSRNADGSRFCSECGASIPVTAAPAQTNFAAAPQPEQAPPAPQQPFTPPVYTQPSQQPYTPPVQPAYAPPMPPVDWSEEKPQKRFPWALVIVLALLAILIAGCLIADVVSDGELNLFGILEQDNGRDRDRDDGEEDEDDDTDDSPVTTRPGAAEATQPQYPQPMETMPSPMETMPTEAPSEMRYYDVVIWCSGIVVDLTREQINRFNSENPYGIFINAVIEPVSEGDAASYMLADISSGADLYCFAQDQTSRLVQAGALSAPDGAFTDYIYTANDAGSVNCASFYGSPVAYPLTNDNGYFMYYDKSIISADAATSMESMIAACEASGTYFCFDLENAWYMSSFFFGTGCHSQWLTDEHGYFIGLDDTFLSQEGYYALVGMRKLLTSSCFRNSSTTYDFNNGASVVVSGSWEYYSALAILGDNLGVAELPWFEAEGNLYHLGSFNGCKLLGVKPQSDADKEEALHLLAIYLTSEQSQLERYEYAGWGPSNINAQQSSTVQSSPALAALYAQAPYSVPQGSIHGGWWDVSQIITSEIYNGTDLWDILFLYYEYVVSLLN